MPRKSSCRLARHGAAAVLAMVSLSGCAELLAAREQRAQLDTDASGTRHSHQDCRQAVAPNDAAKDPPAAYQRKGTSISRWHRITRCRTACQSRPVIRCE